MARQRIKGVAGPMYFAIYKIVEKRQTKWTKMHKKQYNPIQKISNRS